MPRFKFLAGLNQSQQQAFLMRLKVEWTYTSNALEGNSLSLGETQFIIEQGLTVQGKPICEHNEVVGHARAIDLVYALLDQPTLDKEAIFALHRAVQTQSVVDIYCPIGAWKNESNGRYISQDNRLVYLAYPEPDAIEHLMTLWLELYHQSVILDEAQAVLVYTRLHLAFASIHPFFDGNGRMARLLANIPLLKSGYLPIVVKKEARAAYIQTLSEYQRISPTLTQTTTQLLSEEKAFNRVHAFFAEQYQVTQALLSEMKYTINPTS